MSMSAEQKRVLPQEGTGRAGESLPESNSGSPAYSGGGNVLHNIETTTLKSNSKKLVQQAFHPSLFLTRPRSQSLSAVLDDTSQTLTQHTNTMDSVESSSSLGINPPTWQRAPVLRNPKRKKTSSPSPDRTKTSNQFSGLPVDETEDVAVQTTFAKKVPKPPPIILYGIEDVNKLSDLLESVVEKSVFILKIINQNQLRINCTDIEAYKIIIDAVRQKGLIGHTFNCKDKRPYRIVIRNLHYTTPIDEIKTAIELTGNTVVGEIINAKYGPDKKPTSTFFANIQQGHNIKAVKTIRYIYHQSVIIEEPRKRKIIVQCQRCQQYGHSKNYCMRPYRCVKCAESHKTSECPKTDRNTPATCALCLGAHPANYKGCEVYREIYAKKFEKRPRDIANKNKTDDIPTKPTLPQHDTKKKTFNNKNGRSYADATKTTSDNPETETLSTNNRLEEMFLKQSQKLDNILQQMSTLISLITTLVSSRSR